MTARWDELTIVTSCVNYGRYLQDWALSIAKSMVLPGHVVVFTHGTDTDRDAGVLAEKILARANIAVTRVHHEVMHDLGTARNEAVALAPTEWVMHLDADDKILPHGIGHCQLLAPQADVISAGYIRTGVVSGVSTSKARLYESTNGLDALNLSSICSGCSPFRKRLWSHRPYRTHMFGAWDTALWLGFARLGARFVASTVAIFEYRHHADSVFNQRRTHLGWNRVHTSAHLRAIRRHYEGVNIIVPMSHNLPDDRQANWSYVQNHYRTHHADWPMVIGHCPTNAWSKGAAIADALQRSLAEIIVIVDADCIVDADTLQTIIAVVQSGAPWGLPHRIVYRLNADATQRVLSHHGTNAPVQMTDLARPPYEGVAGGGIVVMRRVDYDAIGGIPPAFRGWGSEDRALNLLCESLLGPAVRAGADLLHLYHEPQHMTESPQNMQLLRKLGLAAQQGRDALVQAVYSLPNPAERKNRLSERPIASSIKKTVPSIDLSAIKARRDSLAQRSRGARPR